MNEAIVGSPLVRTRTDADLDECERLAEAVLHGDGYPPYLPGDLRSFLAAPGALAAWVAEEDRRIVGHVALHQQSSMPVMALACARTARSADDLVVVARLLVSPTARRRGIGRSLLHTAATAALAEDRWPILDVVPHLTAARWLYERSGWTCAGTVTVPLPNGAAITELVYLGPTPATRTSPVTSDGSTPRSRRRKPGCRWSTH